MKKSLSFEEALENTRRLRAELACEADRTAYYLDIVCDVSIAVMVAVVCAILL